MADLNYGSDTPQQQRESEHSDYDEEDERFQPTPRAKNADDEQLEAYSTLLAKQMAMNKLRESFKKFDPELLHQAIDDLTQLNMEGQQLDRANALHEDIESCRKALRDARRSKNVDNLQEAMNLVRTYRGVERYLKDDVTKTKILIEKLTVKEEKLSILAMDKNTMAEMKRYAKPPAVVHRIMQAALLLLGEDEETTEKWSKCQTLCNPDGPDGMLRRMMAFSPDDVDPRIAKRSRYLIKDITLLQAQKASPGAGTFYVWTKRVIGDDPNEPIQTDLQYGRERNEAPEEDEEEEDYDEDGRPKVKEEEDDDDRSYIEEKSEHERKLQDEERKKREYEEYVTTLPKVIAMEKKIFADQKRAREQERHGKRRPGAGPTTGRKEPVHDEKRDEWGLRREQPKQKEVVRSNLRYL